MNSHPKEKLSIVWVVFSLLFIAAILAACAPAATTTPQATEPAQVATEAPAATEAPVVTEPSAATEAPTEEVAPSETVTPTEGTEVMTPTETTTSTLDLANLSPDIPDPSEPVVVTFVSWVGGSPAWQGLAEQFTKLHPNITIEFQDVPAEEMRTKLLAQVAANNTPDTAYMDAGTVAEFASRNALVPLDDYISKSITIDPNDYVPAFLQAVKYQDQIFGLPIDGESTGLFYRTDRFEEAGLDPNKPPTTWAELEEYAQKLTDSANKKYGYILFAPEAAYYWYPFLWQAGGETLSPDGQTVIWNSDAGKKAANFYVGLNKYSPPDFLNSNSWDGRVAFANGDVAMYMAGAWFAGTLMTEFPDATGKWATAPLPQDQKCATTIAGDDLVVFKGSKNPEAAYKWIEFVSAPDNMRLLNLGTPDAPATLLPPRLSLLNDPRTFETNPILKGFAENMQCAVVSDVVQEKYGEMEAILNEYLGRAIYGEMDGATAVDQAAAEAQDLVK